MAPQEPSTADKIAAMAKQASDTFFHSSRRTEVNKIYETLEDFTRADPSRKRLVVIGCTGSGKSTLLNVIAGWRLVQSAETDYEFRWKDRVLGEKTMQPLFQAASGTDSVTKRTSFANVHMLGNPERELLIVDTPGHDDPAGSNLDEQTARDKLGEIASDLHDKLLALGHVHTILVLHNDVLSNRLNPATYEVLKMLDAKFEQAGTSVWKHVVVAYSKCNRHETSWRSRLEKKREELCAVIKEKVGGCKIDLPVIALGGGEIEPSPPSADESDGLEKLWEFISASAPLDTSKLQVFEGAEIKWQKLIDERNAAAAEAKAAQIYISIVFKVALLWSVLFWRHAMLPSWLSLLLLNMPGLWDEVLIMAVFFYWIGPQDVLYSAKHFSKIWIKPHVETALGPETVAAGLRRWDKVRAVVLKGAKGDKKD